MKKKKAYPIIWLTGQSNAGKTTLADVLAEKLGAVVLDGDEMRASISTDMSMSKEDRIEHNHRVARLAKVLSKRVRVIVAVIAPFESLRAKIHTIAKPIWVYVKRELPVTEKKPYEAPKKYDVLADSDACTPKENAEAVLKHLKKKGYLR
jgi:adenylylsulfate kinase-like enzyme